MTEGFPDTPEGRRQASSAFLEDVWNVDPSVGDYNSFAFESIQESPLAYFQGVLDATKDLPESEDSNPLKSLRALSALALALYGDTRQLVSIAPLLKSRYLINFFRYIGYLLPTRSSDGTPQLWAHLGGEWIEKNKDRIVFDKAEWRYKVGGGGK